MAVTVTGALAAYSRAAKAIPEGMAPRDGAGSSFADALGEALKGAVQSGRKAEAVSADAIAGKADLTDVVSAVTNAELTLHTVVSIRDRLIQAYQDIIRMPI